MATRLSAKTSLFDPKKWLLCPRCRTGSVSYRSKNDDFRCKRCGAIFQADFMQHTTRIKPKERKVK